MLRLLLHVVVMVVWTAICFVLALLAMLFTLNTDNSLWVARELWSRLFMWVGGFKLEVEGLENVDPKRPTIYVSNHQSTLDIPAHFMAVPVPFRYVAKSQLAWVPFIGWYLWLADHILINRANRQAAVRSLDKAAQKIRGGKSIFLYPEGTRSRDGRVLPFKKGPFALALKARVPVVPISIEGTGDSMVSGSLRIRVGAVFKVKIGKPIDISQWPENDREGLARHVRDIIIDQNLSQGGRGGDKAAALAAAGVEGRGD